MHQDQRHEATSNLRACAADVYYALIVGALVVGVAAAVLGTLYVTYLFLTQ